jgi:hypothetical protein
MSVKYLIRLLCVSPIVIVIGCTGLTGGQQRRAQATGLSQESAVQLRASLNEFGDLFESALERASHDIEENARTRQERRAAVVWKVRMISRSRQVIDQDQPLAALLDSWALCIRMRDYLLEGEGRGLFGKNQDVALRVAELLVDQIERIARSVVPEDRFGNVRSQIKSYAQQYPIRGTFSDGGAPPFTLQESGEDALVALLGIPLLPFHAISRLGAGAEGISEIPGAADRFTEVVRGLPEDARWQLELLLIELEESEIVKSFMESFKTLSESAARFAETAERLPAELRREAAELAADLETRQAAVQTTLVEARETAQAIDATLARAEALAERIDHAVAAITAAGQAWQQTADAVGAATREIQILSGRTGDEPAEPVDDLTEAESAAFDINDYRRTAEAISEGAAEVRALMTDLRATLDDTHPHVRGAIDHAALRAVQIIGVLLLAVLVYRFIVTLAFARVNRRGEPGGS